MTLNEAIEQVVNGADSDAVYAAMCPCTPDEYHAEQCRQAVKDGCDPLLPENTSEQFTELYPEFLTRQEFRDAVKTRRPHFTTVTVNEPGGVMTTEDGAVVTDLPVDIPLEPVKVSDK